MPIIPVDQKFHTLNASTPTKDRGSAQTDSLREIYTMQDIIDSVTTGGGIDFTELGDTPSTYVGAAGQAAIVNGTEDGLIFGAAGASELTELTDTPAGYGTSGQVLTTNGTDATTWEDAPSPVGIDLSFIVRDTAYASDFDHEGTVFNFGFTGALTFGVYRYDGTTWSAASNAAPSSAKGLLGIGLGNAGVLQSGIFALTVAAPFTAGDVLYLGVSGGIINDISGLTSGEVVRVIGTYLGQDGSVYKTYFNPSPDWIEIA